MEKYIPSKYDGHTRFENIAATKEVVSELGKIIINGVFQNLQTTKNPINQIFMRFNDGAGTRIRTVDLLITSQLLYQLSYAGNVE